MASNEFDQIELVSPLPFEFGSCLPRCSDLDIHPDLLDRLEVMYHYYPFTLTSGYRSVAYEKNKGRRGNSAHCCLDEYGRPQSKAVDVRTRHSVERFFVVVAAFRAGFTRIGIAADHVHLDIDPDDKIRPDNCLFLE